MKQWKYFHNGERIGPINEDQLIKKLLENELPRTITVWTDGMFVWKALDETPLAEKLAIPVPAPPAPVVSEPPVSSIVEAPPVQNVPIDAVPFQPAPDTAPFPPPQPEVSPFPEISAPEVPMAPVASTIVPEIAPPPFVPLFAPGVSPTPTGLPPQTIMPELSPTVPQTQDPAPVSPLTSDLPSSDPVDPAAPATPIAQFDATADSAAPVSDAQFPEPVPPHIAISNPLPSPKVLLLISLFIFIICLAIGGGVYLVWKPLLKPEITIVIKALIGLACGIPSLLLAKQRNNIKLGLIAFCICLAGALIEWWLALPIGIAFVLVILTGKNRDTGY